MKKFKTSYIEPGVHMTVDTSSLDRYVPTSELTPGDLVLFWDRYGLFCGLVDASDVSDAKANLQPLPDGSVGLHFNFKWKEEQMSSYHRFPNPILFMPGKGVTNFGPEHLEFLKFLIDEQIHILPRVTHPDFYYDDKLRRINSADDQDLG